MPASCRTLSTRPAVDADGPCGSSDTHTCARPCRTRCHCKSQASRRHAEGLHSGSAHRCARRPAVLGLVHEQTSSSPICSSPRLALALIDSVSWFGRPASDSAPDRRRMCTGNASPHRRRERYRHNRRRRRGVPSARSAADEVSEPESNDSRSRRCRRCVTARLTWQDIVRWVTAFTITFHGGHPGQPGAHARQRRCLAEPHSTAPCASAARAATTGSTRRAPSRKSRTTWPGASAVTTGTGTSSPSMIAISAAIIGLAAARTTLATRGYRPVALALGSWCSFHFTLRRRRVFGVALQPEHRLETLHTIASDLRALEDQRVDGVTTHVRIGNHDLDRRPSRPRGADDSSRRQDRPRRPSACGVGYFRLGTAFTEGRGGSTIASRDDPMPRSAGVLQRAVVVLRHRQLPLVLGELVDVRPTIRTPRSSLSLAQINLVEGLAHGVHVPNIVRSVPRALCVRRVTQRSRGATLRPPHPRDPCRTPWVGSRPADGFELVTSERYSRTITSPSSRCPRP